MTKRKRRKETSHDAVFKVFFSDSVTVEKYLMNYTDKSIYEQLDLTQLRRCDSSSVSGRFGISYSDLVYETSFHNGRPARVLFLFEHKSFQPRYPVYLQLMDYFLQLWEDDIKNGRPLSFILPIVVYHGKGKWNTERLSEYFSGLPETWKAYVPGFKYVLTDLSNMSTDEIWEKKESEYVRNLFLALKLSKKENFLDENLKKVLTFGLLTDNEDRGRILFQTLTLYLINKFDMSQENIQTIKKGIAEDEERWFEYVSEVFGKKWKVEGRKEGLQEASHRFVKRLIEKYPALNNAEIAELADLTEEQVAHIRANW